MCLKHEANAEHPARIDFAYDLLPSAADVLSSVVTDSASSGGRTLHAVAAQSAANSSDGVNPSRVLD